MTSTTPVRVALAAISLGQLVFGAALFVQAPWATALWPFEATTADSFIFLSSIFAAAAASTLWVVATEHYGVVTGIGLDYAAILAPVGVHSFLLARASGSRGLLIYSGVCVGGVLMGLGMMLWGRRFPIPTRVPMPAPIRWSFVVFIVALLTVATRLVLRTPDVIPWTLSLDLGVGVGWMFFGAAAYFAYGLWRPSWYNAASQLSGFLAYDLVLIGPFLRRLPTVGPEHRRGLIIYTTVVVYSGLLAIYYLFIHPATRAWNPRTAGAPPRCPGLPVVGNTHQLLTDPRGLLAAAYRGLGGVFQLSVLGRPLNVIAGDAAKTFMAEGLDERYLTRHRLFDPLEREFGGADFTMAHSGPRHLRLRHPLAIGFSRQAASPFVGPALEAARAVARAWPAGSRPGVTAAARDLAVAQWRRLLGPGAAHLQLRDCERLSASWMMVGAGLLRPWTFSSPWYRASHRRVFEVFHTLVRQARTAPAGDTAPESIVQVLAGARDKAGATLTDAEVVTYLAYGTLGACAYVGRLTAFMLYELARDQTLRERVRAEVRDALRAGLDDASDLRQMRLLQAVYQETLRRHTVSPGMPFLVDRDFEYGGHRLTRGENAIVSPVPLAASETAFRDPERFDPARCLEPRNEHRRGNGHPFGLGNRTCVAGGLVEVMAVTLVAGVLDAGDVSLDPPDYRLGLTVLPLPAPNGRCRVRVAAAPAPAAAEGAPGPRPRPEEEQLAAFPGHDDPDVRDALARAELRSFGAGVAILREGDPADAYYLLQAGGAVVVRGAEGERVADLGPGDGFGELGLLNNAPRSATVLAGPDGATALVLDRESFLAMVAGSDLVAREIRGLMQKRLASNRLRQVAPGLTASAVAEVLPDFTWETREAGGVIVAEGEPAEHFFVVVDGQVTVSRRTADGGEQPVAVLGPGEYFGETGLLHRAPRNATVRAWTDGPVAVLRTDAAGFDRLLRRTGPAGQELARVMLACAERLGAP
ncbi:MAG: cytochrome P450 [Vicinamibacterales bacterium]